MVQLGEGFVASRQPDLEAIDDCISDELLYVIGARIVTQRNEERNTVMVWVRKVVSGCQVCIVLAEPGFAAAKISSIER